MLKPFLKNLLGPKVWGQLKKILGRVNLDEVDIAYDLLCKSDGSKIMIDVGAHQGGSLVKFAEDGWKVLAYEPDPNNREILSKLCEKYPSVMIDNRAVSDEIKENLPFYTSEVSTGISSLSTFHESHTESLSVNTTTLDQVLSDNNLDSIDFLKIDTEGHDLFVLRGLSWGKVLPRVVLCEFEDRKTKPLGYDFHELAKYLESKGYKLLISEWYPLIEYGEKHRWRRFANYPCDLLDKNAWGNIIAVSNDELKASLDNLSKEYSVKYS
jgi:FkbM family methyltransferase